MIPEFKNKPFNTLNTDQKIAFVERVCMEHYEYLANFTRNSMNYNFLRYWKDQILNVVPSNSLYLDNYVYRDKAGLCILAQNGEVASIKYNTEEVIIFVHNAVNDIPLKSPIIERLKNGATLEELQDNGVPSATEATKIKPLKPKGKPVNPNSLAQRIKRGELTRYEAYQKKILNEDDSL